MPSIIFFSFLLATIPAFANFVLVPKRITIKQLQESVHKAAQILGSMTSERKAKAARRNAKLLRKRKKK